jgi:hypothetical protein
LLGAIPARLTTLAAAILVPSQFTFKDSDDKVQVCMMKLPASPDSGCASDDCTKYYVYFNADRVSVHPAADGCASALGGVLTCCLLIPQNQKELMYVDPTEGTASFMAEVRGCCRLAWDALDSMASDCGIPLLCVR